jgi:hypothetical protein
VIESKNSKKMERRKLYILAPCNGVHQLDPKFSTSPSLQHHQKSAFLGFGIYMIHNFIALVVISKNLLFYYE